MNRRFDRLGTLDQAVLITLITSISMFLFPFSVAAQTSNQTPIVFEIKNVKIPTTTDLAYKLNMKDDAVTTTTVTIATPPTPTPIPTTVRTTVTKTAITYTNVPPKALGSDRVYMQEPEIRAYVCPKLGDKCNIFMAVLAAENGTHECTRDNRGLNRNGSIDIGLAQINWTPNSPYTFEQLQDCKFNLDIALAKVRARGFQPWSAYNNGSYLKHLPAMLASANNVATTEVASVPVQ